MNVLVPVSARWFELGIVFGFNPKDLDWIRKRKPHCSVTDWLIDILVMKMNRSPEFGWSDVIQALAKIGCGALAESIQREYFPQGEEK